MGRIAGLLLLMMHGVSQAQDTVPVGIAGGGVFPTAQAVADKKVATKAGSKSVPMPAETTVKTGDKEEGGKPDAGKASEEAPGESVQLKGLRG